jgi:hypothetical protein
MNGRFQMQGGKRFCRKRLMQTGSSGTLIWLEEPKPLMSLLGPNGGSVAMDSGFDCLSLCGERTTLRTCMLLKG